jgi:hypothetical protein
MPTRRHLLFVLAGALASLGASYRTTNFVVQAPTLPVAQQIGQKAEQYRREKAHEWLGQDMPNWPEPCPLRVKVTMGGAGGSTSFAFDQGYGRVLEMNIEGTLERVLNSVLPHEITHTVFAYYFGRPVPRWADEGGSVLSEDDLERGRHDQLVRQILNQRQEIPLRRLFVLTEYPHNLMALYAEGYSVSNFLVASSNRPAFLRFVAHGMQYGWDSAVRTHYGYSTVDELEKAWLSYLRNTRQQPTLLARNPNPPAADPASRTIVRLTAPPAQPLTETPTPVFRGQAPGVDDEAVRRSAGNRPGYLPEYYPTAASRPQATGSASATPASQDQWQPPSVRLGTPQFLSNPSPRTGTMAPSPVGYPN